MSQAIVELSHITKRFPGVVANNDISLCINKGEIFALLGENGAGKSTLMSMLFGMYEPDEGEIFIRGERVKISSPNHATKLNIGMVHQHFKLVSNYTITENIVLGIEPQSKFLGFLPVVNLKTAHEKILQISKKYGLQVDPLKRIDEVNVSSQQRVEILKMLYREAEILIFDEPTAVLTPQEIGYLLEIIKSLRDSGKTIILITHKLEEIKQIANRCAVLCGGKLMGILDVKETSTKQMAQMMVGREVLSELQKSPPSFGEVVLSVKNLCVKNIDGFNVVDDVSFDIRAGEVFAVAGVSGNGQVELADAIAGLAEVFAGNISFMGENISQALIKERYDKGISYIPEDRQTFGLVLDFILSENAVLKSYKSENFCKNGVLLEGNFAKFANSLIEKYDIRCGKGEKTVVRSMSGGNQQKVIVAREIEHENSLIIFVQPTRGLDVGAIENIHKQILQQRDNGKAILLISLELEEIMNCADTIGVIYNGKINKIAPAAELTTREVGEFMMGVKRDEKQ